MVHKLSLWSRARRPAARPAPPREMTAAGRTFVVEIARHPRARRYVLRLTPAGTLRLTVPRSGSIAEGLKFAGGQTEWVAREWQRAQARWHAWDTGTEIWYRGARVTLVVHDGTVTCGDRRVALAAPEASVREALERDLRALATTELAARVLELAADRQIAIGRISVRNQRSRWGSCSSRGAITLNWRLVQMPARVADYVILHELAHRRQPNHSPRFWREVEALCPGWQDDERWLRKHGKELL